MFASAACLPSSVAAFDPARPGRVCVVAIADPVAQPLQRDPGRAGLGSKVDHSAEIIDCGLGASPTRLGRNRLEWIDREQREALVIGCSAHIGGRQAGAVVAGILQAVETEISAFRGQSLWIGVQSEGPAADADGVVRMLHGSATAIVNDPFIHHDCRPFGASVRHAGCR